MDIPNFRTNFHRLYSNRRNVTDANAMLGHHDKYQLEKFSSHSKISWMQKRPKIIFIYPSIYCTMYMYVYSFLLTIVISNFMECSPPITLPSAHLLYGIFCMIDAKKMYPYRAQLRYVYCIVSLSSVISLTIFILTLI